MHTTCIMAANCVSSIFDQPDQARPEERPATQAPEAGLTFWPDDEPNCQFSRQSARQSLLNCLQGPLLVSRRQNLVWFWFEFELWFGFALALALGLGLGLEFGCRIRRSVIIIKLVCIQCRKEAHSFFFCFFFPPAPTAGPILPLACPD